MQTIRKVGDGILFGSVIFLLFLLVFQHRVNIPSWLQVVGRMHPMFLHFPIVLLLLSFITAWIPLKEKNNDWLTMLSLVAALSAVITAVMGLLLSLTDDRSGTVLEWHKWAGLSIAILGFVFYTFRKFFTDRKIISKSYTILATAAIVMAGHFGADLTHGENYLLAPIAPEVKLVPVDEAIVFKDVIKPIFDKKCSSCHSEESLKGGLMLEDSTGIAKGGKTGPLFIPGNPDSSLIIHRLLLPDEEKKHMPPISKPALAKDEIALIHAWIKAGAMMNAKLVSLPAKDSFRILASRFLAPSDQPLDQPVYDFSAADEKKVTTLNNNYRVIEQQGINSPALSVHFYGKNAYSKKSLEELLPLKQQIIELSLAKMPVKDDEMSIVKQMIHLQKLNLNYTDITDKSLDQLQTLKKLNELALAGTNISATSLQKLITALPELTNVVIWDTKIDSVTAASFQNKFKKVTIETGYKDDGKTIIALSPPMIKTEERMFTGSLNVELKHPLPAVEIRYTTDGSQPDSVTSPVYTKPVFIDHYATLIAKAYKKGWYGSEPAKATFIRKGFVPDSIELVTQPNSKYSGTGKLMLDDDIGDLNFRGGQWLGYHKDDATFYLYFNSAVQAKNVLVNILSNSGAYIFPPTDIEVWGGADKNNLGPLGKLKLKTPKKDDEAALQQEIIALEPAQIKVLKIHATHIKSLPEWRKKKGENGWIFISEIVVN